jgi:hypothetical protein
MPLWDGRAPLLSFSRVPFGFAQGFGSRRVKNPESFALEQVDASAQLWSLP